MKIQVSFVIISRMDRLSSHLGATLGVVVRSSDTHWTHLQWYLREENNTNTYFYSSNLFEKIFRTYKMRCES